MSWYLAVLKNYAGFGGRARRKEYWMFTLINFIVIVPLYIIFLITLFSNTSEKTYSVDGENYSYTSTQPSLSAGSTIVLILLGIYGLSILIPSLAVTVRRLHDTGRSGGWYFISFVPLVGAIILLVFLATEGQPGPNVYGPNPKQLDPAGWQGGHPQQGGYPQQGYQAPPQQGGYPQQGYSGPQQGYQGPPQG